MQLKPLYPALGFCEEFGIPKTRLYELIKRGDLTARKVNGRTYITGDDAQKWLESLPAIQPAA